mgnify:CR=1 FL=1
MELRDVLAKFSISDPQGKLSDDETKEVLASEIEGLFASRRQAEQSAKVSPGRKTKDSDL